MFDKLFNRPQLSAAVKSKFNENGETVWGVINTSGKVIIPFIYLDYNDALTAWRRINNSTTGDLTKEQKEAIRIREKLVSYYNYLLNQGKIKRFNFERLALESSIIHTSDGEPLIATALNKY